MGICNYCLLGSMVLYFYGILNSTKNPTLSKKICPFLDKKASKCKKNVAMKFIHAEVTRLQRLKRLPLDAVKQVFDMIIPVIADDFNVNCLVHETSSADQILYQYPRIFDETRRTIHLHSLPVNEDQGHISMIVSYAKYKRSMAWACLFCDKSDHYDNYVHRCTR